MDIEKQKRRAAFFIFLLSIAVSLYALDAMGVLGHTATHGHADYRQ
jgi:hypothetical protein